MKRYSTLLCKYTSSVAALFLLVSCFDLGIQEEIDQRPINFTAGRAYNLTRAATTDVQGALFDKDEEINVYIEGSDDGGTNWTPGVPGYNGGLVGTPTVYVTSEDMGGYNQLTPKIEGEQAYYPLNPIGGNASSVKARIHAIYPKSVLDYTEEFRVQYDQTTVDNYKNSDLMFVAPFEHSKNNSVVNLPFQHKMAKLIITAIPDGGVTIDDVITVGSIKRGVKIDPGNGDFDYSVEAPTVIPLFDDKEDDYKERKITMLNGGAVLFPPQYLESAVEFIKITGRDEAGQPQTAQFDIIGKSFLEGRVYKLNLHISNADFTPHSTTGAPHTSTITGWSEDYDELTVTPSGGYSGVSIADIDGVVSNTTSSSGKIDEDGYYVYSTDNDRNPVPCCPRPTVTYGDDQIPMTEGVDFRYQYVDNINAGNNSQVMIIGMGSYAGLAALKPFTIRRAKGKISFPEGSDKTGENAVDFNPDENIGFIKAINTGDGVVTYEVIADGEGETTECASVDPVDGYVTLQSVGKCTIKATVATGRNFDYPEGDNTCTYKLEIEEKEVKEGDLTITYSPHQFTYDGKAKALTKLVVADGEHTLVEDVDYTYTLTDKEGRYEGAPIHHGTALLTITGKGNYSKDTNIKIDIPINQAKPTLTVKTTELALGKYESAAPKDRRKTREATTEDWAKAKIRYSLDAVTDVKANDYIRVNNAGLLTGLKVHDASDKTTVYVNVDADDSEYQDWEAADQETFDVKVYESDFVFRIARYAYDDYREPQLHIESNGIPEGAHTRWVCPAKGEWQIDCYGAQGGTTPKYTTERTGHYRTNDNYGPKIVNAQYSNQGLGGRGAHIAGRINLPKNIVLHVNLGQKGRVVYPGEQRLRGTEAEIYVDKTTPTNNKSRRGKNGGKVNGDLGYIKAGDYEWAAFAWNGGGGMVWGAHNMYLYPWFYVQDNYFVGNTANTANSPVATGLTGATSNMGQSYAMYPITGGGGATDVSLAWDEDGGVYSPPTGYSDADRTSTETFSYIDENGHLNYVAADYGYRFQKWMAAHNMVNREHGVGVHGDNSNIVGVQWKNPAHLYSRIIVAGGGGGGLYYDSSNTYGDGGDGGVWEGTRGLFQDYGEGGYINAAGRGGIWRNWKMGSPARNDDRTDEYTCSGQTTNYPSDIVYNDGPNGGGWSGTDGMFGEGGNTFQPAQGCGGGGGGWYGGGAGNEDGSNGPGGGGSSYLWTDKESVRTYISSTSTARTNNGINHSVSWGSTLPLYRFYDTLDADYLNYNGFKPERWHKKASNFYQFMPTNAVAKQTRGSTLGIECPFFHQIVTKDTGANAGDGWAKITLVEIDDDQ